MLTAWCLTVAFASPWLAGAPLLWLVRGARTLRPADWLWVPFVGLAGLITALEPLVVFADVPLKRSAPWFAAAVAGGWVALLACRSGRATLRAFPVRTAALTLGAYLAMGFGVLVQGADRYRGNMLSDQYQYVALAQFLIEEPYSTAWPDVGHRAWLVQPMGLRGERIGQSVIHGYLAVIAGRDALDLYFPTQLLGSALLCPAVLLLAQQFRLDRRLSTCAAVAAALAPGIATLQSFCCLSHILCLPALVAHLAAVIRLARGGSLRPLSYAAVTFALGLSVYTEFVPMFFGTAGAALVAGLAVRTIRVQRVATVAAGLALAAALSPGAVAQVPSIWARSTAHGGANTGAPVPVSAACVWVHSNSAARIVTSSPATAMRSIVSGGFAAAALGAGWFVLRAARRNPGALPAVAGATALAVPPLLLWAVKPDSTYAIGKLIWTLTPVLVLFAACAARALIEVLQRAGVSRRGAARFAFAAFAAVLALQSFREQKNYLEPDGVLVRLATAWNDPALAELCAALRTRPSDDVVVALPAEAQLPEIEATAVCYHGRHHRVWLASPGAVWFLELDTVPVVQLTDLTAVPPGALVVLPRGAAPPNVTGFVFHNEKYEIVRLAEIDRQQVERLRAARPGTARAR